MGMREENKSYSHIFEQKRKTSMASK